MEGDEDDISEEDIIEIVKGNRKGASKKAPDKKESDKPVTKEEILDTVNEAIKDKYGDDVVLNSLGVYMTNNPRRKEAQNQKVKGKEGLEDKMKINFDLKPDELINYLDKYVIKQNKAKQALSTKICTHYHRAKKELESGQASSDDIKKNIMMIGPTGCGKTYLIKKIAEKLNVPFIQGDATKFSETGYVGGDVEDLVRDLVKKANGNVQLASYGIIFIDEIDKITKAEGMAGRDVSGRGVQINLLKLLEETEVDVVSKYDPGEAMKAAMGKGEKQPQKINTRNILFIVSGAFPGLEDLVKDRAKKKVPMGFNQAIVEGEKLDENMMDKMTAEDLVRYGLEREFVGRIPVRVILEELNEDDLYHILKNSKGSIIQSKKRDFLSYGIKLDFTDDALIDIAKRAYREKTGARALVSVTEEVLLPYEAHLPTAGAKELTVTKELVSDPEGFFIQMMGKNLSDKQKDDMKGMGSKYLEKFAEEYFTSYGIQLVFEKEATQYLIDKSIAEQKTPYNLCAEIFENYDSALKMVGANKFHVSKPMIDDPKGHMKKIIDAHFNS